MAYNYITQYDSPNYTAGRQGNAISSITIHWWGDPSQNPALKALQHGYATLQLGLVPTMSLRVQIVV